MRPRPKKRSLYSQANRVLAAARALGLNDACLHQLPGYRAHGVLDRVLESFATEGLRSRTLRWLWTDLREPRCSIYHPNGISPLLSLGAPDAPVWLLVEKHGEETSECRFWVFEATLGAAVATMQEYGRDECYVVAKSLDWLVARNHHDFLIASGGHAYAVIAGMLDNE